MNGFLTNPSADREYVLWFSRNGTLAVLRLKIKELKQPIDLPCQYNSTEKKKNHICHLGR